MKKNHISRSKLIREAVDRLAENLSKIFKDKSTAPPKTSLFDSLVGSINEKSANETNYTLEKDNLYLHD